MLTIKDIPALRLVAQQLTGTAITTAEDMVHYLGAMQAQDYAMSKWAIGTRLPVTEQTVEQAINEGRIVRTHVLRPTWHLIAAADAHWMLSLTAPHIRKAYTTMGNRLGIDAAFLKNSNKIISKLLAKNQHLTREEIMKHIKLPGEMANDFRPSLVMMHAELEGIACNGAMRGKEPTYALLDERVAAPKPIGRDEALARLARMYFTSHGPATAADFAWWSGLPAADVKKAVDFVRGEFEIIQDGKTAYLVHHKHIASFGKAPETTHLLPAFDEFLISYQDRTASIPLELQKHAFTRNGIFKPVIVVNGKVVGIWKRTFKKDTVLFEIEYIMPVSKKMQKEIVALARKFGDFCCRTVVVA